eukprot:g2935.t1
MGNETSKAPQESAKPSRQQQQKVPPGVAQIQKNKSKMGDMEKKIAHVENMVKKERAAAKKKVAAGDKRGALTHLKRAKRYEKQADNYTNVLLNLETMTESLINQVNNIEAYNAVKETKMAMDQMKNEMNVDDVTDMRDDIEEHMADMEEINNLLGEQIGGDVMDEDDLEDEYAALMEDQAREQLGDMPVAPTMSAEQGKQVYQEALNDALPVAPTGNLEEDEDEVFDELEAIMSA